MKHFLTFSQIQTGFILNCEARRLKPNTVKDYKNTYKNFTAYLQHDVRFDHITRQDIEGFLASIKGVSNNTLKHHHSALGSLYTWAVSEQIVPKNLVRLIQPPKVEKKEILPFTEQEMRLMLAAIPRSASYKRPGKGISNHAVLHPERGRAILLMLLDTGIRIGELRSLKIFQVDRQNHRVQVMGKGAIERSIPFSPRTAQAIWRYLTTRPNAEKDEPLFASSNNRHLDKTQLGKSIRLLGIKAGVQNVHPHRFRHTFAIQYLRNGGDPYTLQKLLGHSTLEMVKHYLALAQVDLDRAHKRASPVDNWAL